MVLLIILLVVLVVRSVNWRGQGEIHTSGSNENGVYQEIHTSGSNENGVYQEIHTSGSKENGVYQEVHTSGSKENGVYQEIHTSGKMGEVHSNRKKGDIHISGTIDINRADSADLEALPGIGPVLSVRIIKYRKLVGYYYSIDQLNDVYGLDKEVIEMNRNLLSCDSTLLRRININTASYSELLRHPYINREQVEAILSYRQISGLFRETSELVINRIFTKKEMKRINPYLVIY